MKKLVLLLCHRRSLYGSRSPPELPSGQLGGARSAWRSSWSGRCAWPGRRAWSVLVPLVRFQRSCRARIGPGGPAGPQGSALARRVRSVLLVLAATTPCSSCSRAT